MTEERYYYLFGDTPKDLPTALSIDTETTGLKWTDDLLGISLAWRDPNGEIRDCYLSKVPGLFQDDIWPESRVRALVWDLFTTKMVFGHYFSFDARVLFREFEMTPMYSLDTWHMAKSTMWRDSYSLANLAPLAGINDPEWLESKKKRANMAELSPHVNSAYARKDARYTLQLFEYLYPAYEATGMVKTDTDFNRLTYAIMSRGFPVNEELLDQRIKSESPVNINPSP